MIKQATHGLTSRMMKGQTTNRTHEEPAMIDTHATATARTINVVNIRKTETTSIKAACGRRIARSKVVAAELATCSGCQRQLAADAAQFARTGRN